MGKYMKRQKKKTIDTAYFAENLICIGCLLFLQHFLEMHGMIGSTKGLIKKESEVKIFKKQNCILVLGAGVHKDNSPSLMLRDRLETACRLYEEGAASKIIMSGDHGRKDYDEVQVMKDYAIDKGIPSSDIFMDHAGFSTYESMYRAKAVFQVKNMIVVSQKYHLYRALYSGKGLGMKVTGVPAKETRYAGQMYRDLRELLARDKDVVSVLRKTKPTYLGEAIPVSGDGDVTNDQ